MSATGAAAIPGTLLDAYAARLGFVRPLPPDLSTLLALHRAHVEAVPFETSSVLFGEPIVLEPEALVRKLAIDGRGGFCYELNGAFATLLEDAGFPVERLEASTFDGDGSPGPHFDHLALRVTLADPWLVDVGFGYSFVEPLRFETGIVQLDPLGEFRLDADDDGVTMLRRRRDGSWGAEYRMSPGDHDLSDFAEMCRHHGTSPDSVFAGGWVCARLTTRGAVTLWHRQLVDTTGTEAIERTLSDDELPAVLASSFGIQARVENGRWVRSGG